jgi:lipopolysaccharide export system protein LptA
MRQHISLSSINGFALTRTVACLALASLIGFAPLSLAEVKNSLHLKKLAVAGADDPIEVTSRRLSMKFGKGKAQATYESNVKVRQGDVTMSCDRLVIDYEMKDSESTQGKRDPKLTKDVALSNLKTITATGNVKIVQGDRMATAGKAVFDNKKRTIELTEGPKLWLGPDRLEGNKIVFYIDEERSEVDGEVKTRISPGTPKKEQEK